MGSWSDATGRRRVGAIEDLEMAAEEAGEVEAAEGEVEATQKAAEVAAEEGQEEGQQQQCLLCLEVEVYQGQCLTSTVALL